MAFLSKDRVSQRTGMTVALGGNNTITMSAGPAGKPPLMEPFSHGVGEPGGSAGEAPRRGKSPLGSLRARERSVRLIGRDEAIETATSWREQPAADGGLDHRVLVVHGPGGAGKTRLGAEILQSAKEAGWLAGFLSESFRVYQHPAQLTHPSRPTMIAIDYAEARHTDLRRMFAEAPVGHDGEAPLRLILIVREGIAQPDAWLHRLEGEADLGPRAERLLAPEQLMVISLDESLPAVADREALWQAAAEGYEDGPDAAPAYLGDGLFERPLFILLDAHRVHSEAGDGVAVAPTEESLFKSVLKHERRYWESAAKKMKLELGERRMYQVAAVATLMGGVARTAFEGALRALDWLRDDEDLLLDVCDWWCSVYETGAGGIRGLEPDIVGEHLVMRALGPREERDSKLDGSLQIDKLRSLIGLATPTGRQRLLRVLTRIASSGSSGGAEGARAVLAELLDAHLQDFLPATFTQAAVGFDRGDPGEPLARTVAAAVLACDRLQLVSATPAGAELGDSGEEANPAAIRLTAIGIVRRQIESVAKRELESGRWSVERFADVMTWALRLDLEAGEDERAHRELRQIEQLDPPPHMALAAMRREIGRDHMAAFRAERARPMFEAALEDLEAAGERESALGHVIQHQLGDALQHDGHLAEAAPIHEQAFEGLRDAEGLGSENTIAALTSLVYCLGATDLDAALARRDAVLEELAASEAEEKAVESVRGIGVGAKLAAGRVALAREDHDLVTSLLESALEELEAEGEGDSLHAYVILETLAVAAAKGGDPPGAVELCRKALEGKRRLRDGYDAPGTVATLLNLASMLAEENLDEAVTLLDEAAGELRDAGSERCESVVNAQAALLNRAGRLSEGLAVTRAHHQATLVRDVRRAVFDTIADPAPRESILPFAVAVDGALLAAELLDVGDPRLLALASRLGLLSLERATAAFGRRISTATLEALAEDPGSVHEDIRGLAGSLQMPGLRRDVPTVAAALADVRDRIRGALLGLRADPAVAGAGIAGSHDPAALVEAGEVRRWLLRCGFEGPAMQGPESGAAAVGGILSWALGGHSGALEPPDIAASAIAIWRRGAPDAKLLADEEGRLRAELANLPAAEGDAAGWVGMGKASALLCAAGAALEDGAPDEAEELCRASLAALEVVERADTGLGWAAREQLGEVAASAGKFAEAAVYAEAAVQGWQRLEGEPIGGSTVSAILRLADYRARFDLDQALAGIDGAITELEGAGAESPALAKLRRGRVGTVHATGGRASMDGDVERAEQLYRQAQDELAALGETDSALSLGVLSDIGIAALKRGDSRRAIELLERALDGWLPLVGPADTRTQTTLSTLARAIEKEDPEAALQRLDAGLEECLEDGAEGSDLARLRFARASILCELGGQELESRKVGRAAGMLEEALDELDAIGQRESSLFYVTLHELGNASLVSRDVEAARDFFRRAMEGKRQLRGIAHSDTIVSVASFAECLAMSDVDAATAVVEEVEEELRAEEATDADLMPLGVARATILRIGGETAFEEGRAEEAGRLYERALEALEQVGMLGTQLEYALIARLADVAAAGNDFKRAATLYREAYEGLRRVVGISDDEAVSVVARLARVVSETDRDAAEELLVDLLSEFGKRRAPSDRVVELRWVLMRLLVQNARLARSEGDLDAAETRLHRAREELAAAGEGESRSAYVVLHELAGVALSRGERSAQALYREAMEGKRALLGLAHRSTIITICEMAEAQAGDDYEGAVRTLEEALSELAELDAAPELAGMLRTTLARAHLVGGRMAENARKYDEAERIYGRALAEVAESDGRDPNLASVLNHDLADVAAKRKDPERAIGLYREAFEGKRRLRGMADRDTIATLLSLGSVLARFDLPGALALYDEALEELEGADGAERLAKTVREGRTVAYLHAGREAEAGGDLDEAGRLYRATLEDLEARGVRDHLLAYVALHDLGDVAMACEQHEEAAAHYRAAFEGKRRLGGLGVSGTTITLVRLSEALGVADPPSGAELTAVTLAQLEQDGEVEEAALEHARRARATALLGFGFHSLHAGDLSTARESCEEIPELLEATDESAQLIGAGALACLGEVAEREEDGKRAARLYRDAFETMRRQGLGMDTVAVDYLLRCLAAISPLEPKAALTLIEEIRSDFERENRDDVLRKLRAAGAGAFVEEGRQLAESDFELAERRFDAALDELADLGVDDPEAVSVVVHELGGVAARRGDHECAVERFERALSEKRSALGIAAESTIISLGGLVEALLATEPARAIELLDRWIEELRTADAGAERLAGVRQMRAVALMLAGRRAVENEGWDEAESRLRRSLQEAGEIGDGESHLVAVITHDLGDVAMGKHEFERAAELYGSALEIKRRELGFADQDTQVTLRGLACATASSDLPAALALVDEALEEAGDSEDAEQLSSSLRENRPLLYLFAGRAAERATELDQAERHYRAVLEQLQALDARDSMLAYVALHDLGDVALAREEATAAAPLLEEALRGKRRLAGSADRGTIVTLLRLADALVAEDPPAAFTMLEGAADQLAEEGADRAVALIEEWLKGQEPAAADDTQPS